MKAIFFYSLLLIFLLILLPGRALCQGVYGDEVIQKRTIYVDTLNVGNISTLIKGKTLMWSASPGNGDSIRITIYGLRSTAVVMAVWAGTGYLGELGLRNINATGFTIFSNTDEIQDLEIYYLIDNTGLPLP